MDEEHEITSSRNTNIPCSQRKKVSIADIGYLSENSSETDDIALGDVITNETNETLIRLQKSFAEADEDGGGGLDMEEFRNAMRQSMGKDVSDHDLDMVFMKVDSNCDGTVDWDEYLTYLLLECRERDIMNVKDKEPFPQGLRTCKSCGHRDSVISILFIQSKIQAGSTDLSNGRYASVSRDGIVCFWTTGLSLCLTYKIEEPPPRTKEIWITAAAFIPASSYMLFSTTARDILFYEVSAGGNRIQRISRINGFETCLSCLTYHDLGSTGNSILLFGDCRGSVGSVNFAQLPHLTDINGKGKKKQTTFQKENNFTIPFAALLKQEVANIKAQYTKNIHEDEVCQIHYIHQLGYFLSCCAGAHTSLFIGDIEKRIHSAVFKVKQGVFCCDYSYILNIIVTGGYDAIVRVWNPYVTRKPSIYLQGHQAPIRHVTINNVREQVISVAENNEILIHDLNTQVCLQRFIRKMMHGLGKRPALAIFFNQTKQDLIMATKTLGILEQKSIDLNINYISSQMTSTSLIIFNPVFQHIVSVGEDSMICVWSLNTGEKVMQFCANKHVEEDSSRIDCGENEITAMTFDPTYRRLITATKNDSLKIWNYNNGACLRMLPANKTSEITSIICSKNRIITGGWSGQITEYVDCHDDDTVRLFTPKHKDDILDMSLYSPQMLASCSFDGDIFIWSLEIARLLYYYNFKYGILPQTLIFASGNSGMEIARKFSIEDLQGYQKLKCVSIHCEASGYLTDTKDCARKLWSSNSKQQFENSVYPPPDMTKLQYAVEKVVFLQTRPLEKDTASLMVGYTNGYVRAWSVHTEGSLLKQFFAPHHESSKLTAMVTDSKNKYFITSDSAGYIKVWGIANYCINLDSLTHSVLDEVVKKEYDDFPFVKWHKCVTNAAVKHKGWLDQERYFNGTCPQLITSFKGHVKGIVSIDLSELTQNTLIISAAEDYSIRIWDIKGHFLGIFGQKNWWYGVDQEGIPKYSGHETDQKKNQCMPINRIPSDIRRVASASTLRVVNVNRPKTFRDFKLLKMILKWIAKISSEGGKGEDKGIKISKVNNSFDTTDYVDLEIGSEALVSSEILSQAYKKTTRHRKTPSLNHMKRNPFINNLSVFKNLPIDTHLHPIPDIQMPETVKEVILRNVAMQQVRETEKESAKIAVSEYNRRFSRAANKIRSGKKTVSSFTRQEHIPSNSIESDSSYNASFDSIRRTSSTVLSGESQSTQESLTGPRQGSTFRSPSKRLSYKIQEVLDRQVPTIKENLPSINKKIQMNRLSY